MQIRGNFSDFFFETQLPAIKSVIFESYRDYPMVRTEIFDMESSERSIEQYSQVSGVGNFAEIPENNPVPTDQPVQGFDKTFRHAKFGLGIPVTREMISDDKFGLVKKYSRELARSAQTSREIQAAAIFNNGFSGSYTGPDGKALFASDHPLVKAGGTQSNLLTVTADLSYVSLQSALTQCETMKSASGKFMRVPFKKLLAAPANRWTAMELTKSSDRPDTANRAKNTLGYAIDGMVEPIIWPYLTDDDAWFLLAAPTDTGLVWIDREKPYIDTDEDKKRQSMLTMMFYRCSQGWNDYNGVFGSAGA